MEVELQATCSALGYLEADQYHKEPDCLETVKDLILYLKREDESCDIRRQLGEAQIMQNDLIPIVKEYKDDSTLLDAVLRLMVNLTQPAVLCFKNTVPEDKTNRNFYLEIVNQLQTYKQAFADEALFAVLTKKLGDLLQLDWEHRQEEDRLLIERMLILVRNVLHVPPDPQAEKRTDDDATIHDQVLWALHVSGMEDLLLYISSSEEERQYCLHVLEIISLMFREQTPEQLANAGLTRSLSEREKDQRELESVRELEKVQKKAQILKYSTRHSRFGGTFTVANMKSISNKELIYHRSLGNVNDHSFDYNKTKRKRPKNRKPIKEVDVTRRSTLSIRMFLREFCIQFLENCYNPLMYSVKDILVRSKAQENDETYHLWSMRFFMEFSRLYKFRVDVISETLSVPTFHYVHTQLVTYHDMMLTNKKEGIVWSKRMHLAVKAYHELLHTVQAMDKSADPQLMESARVIKSNVFYMMEYRDVFITLLKKFDETRQSREFLRDVIECVHLFLKMLEAFCKGQSHFMVQKKGRRKHKKKPRKAAAAAETEFSPEQLEDLWDEVSSDLSAMLQGRADLPHDVTPFDAASEVDEDQQRIEAVTRIQDSLREQRAGEAVAILRAAREVWPDRDDFGQTDISPEEEFMALREIFMTNIPRPNHMQPQDPEEEIADQGDESEIEEEERQAVNMAEQEFDLKDFVLRFAHHQIVRSYGLLLMDFEKYSPVTNHCCVKMLHRIAYECKAIGMLFQMSLFRIFQRLMCDPVGRSKRYLELATFAKHIVRRFFEVAQTNSKVFMEILFWKGIRESIEINEGYGSFKANHAKGPHQLWTEEQDEELKSLYERYHDNCEGDIVDQIMTDMGNQNRTRRSVVKQMVYLGLVGSAAELKKSTSRPRQQVWSAELEQELIDLYHRYKDCDEPGVDAVDQIVAHLSDNDKTRRHVVRHLTQLGFISGAADLKKNRSKASNRVWLEEHQMELQEVYQRFKHSDDPLGNIISNLGIKRSKQKVTEKLLELGLVRDKSELYKRRRSKKKPGDSEEEEDEEGVCYDREPRAEAREDVVESASDEEESSSAPSGDESEDEDTELSVFGLAVVKMARKLRKKGFENQIKWMSATLKSTADDREEDGDTEPVPVVSLTEEHDTALEDKGFKRMLKKIGLKPPDNQQERFWRIPGLLAPSDLRCRADYLMNVSSSATKENKKANSRIQALQSLAKNRKKDQKAKDKDVRHKRRSAVQVARQITQASSAENSPEKEEGSGNKKSRVMRTVDSDSDESDDERLVIDTESNTDAASNKRTRNSASDDENTKAPSSVKKSAKRAKIHDDSDEDKENQVSFSKTKSTKTNPTEIASSDDEARGSLKTSVRSNKAPDVDSSDSEDDIPLVSTHRTKQKSNNEDSDYDMPTMNNNNGEKVTAVNGVSNSDSDSDTPLISKARPTLKSKPSESLEMTDSDSDDELLITKTAKKTEASFPATMLTQQFSDSDSDVEDHIPLKRTAKKNLIDSDSD